MTHVLPEAPSTIEMRIDGEREPRLMYRTLSPVHVDSEFGHMLWDYIDPTTLDPNDRTVEPEVRGCAMYLPAGATTPIWELFGGETGRYYEVNHVVHGAGSLAVQRSEGGRVTFAIGPEEYAVELGAGDHFQITTADPEGLLMVTEMPGDPFNLELCERRVPEFPSEQAM